MNEKEIKSYYERIEKLLNGANKETYGFAPEEIRQILKWYEYLQQRIDKAIKYIKQHSNNMAEYLDVYEVKDLLEILKGENK